MPADMERLLELAAEVTGQDLDAVRAKAADKEVYTRRQYEAFKAAGRSDDEFYAETDAYVHELINWDTDPDKAALARRCGALLPHSLPVLDFGCGVGTVLDAFHGAGFRRLEGVDLNRYNRAFTSARFRGAPGIGVRILRDLGEASNGQGIVVCLHVLEHVPDPASTLRQLRSKLLPGGLLLAVAPFSLVGPDFPEHRLELKDLRLQDLVVEAGLKLTEVVPFGSFKGHGFELVVARNP